jgi:predicted Rossmann-fold nucleotide-binding protein
MGAVAKAAYNAGSRVHGVTPHAIVEYERKVDDADMPDALRRPDDAATADAAARSGITVVGSMHERKHLMAKLSSAFLVLPGGCAEAQSPLRLTLTQGRSYGTLEARRLPI